MLSATRATCRKASCRSRKRRFAIACVPRRWAACTCASCWAWLDKLGARGKPTVCRPLWRGWQAGRWPPVRFQSKLDPGLFRTVMDRGNRWLEANHTVNPPIWPYYLLYSIERYWTFRR